LQGVLEPIPHRYTGITRLISNNELRKMAILLLKKKSGETPTLILQGSEIRVFGSKTSTTASGITAFFMQDMLKP
jgi:hypothetical protein